MEDRRCYGCLGLMPNLPRLTCVLLTGFLYLSSGVHIQPVTEPIKAKDTDCLVILPCDFSTDTYETPQITWYQEKIDGRREIMRYDIKNRMSSYGEFLNRVAQGNKGALVVINPKSRDSGNYTCEVEVDNETPSWTKNTVALKVLEVPEQKEVTCPMPGKASKGLIAAVVSLSLTSLACMFILGRRGITLTRQAWKTFMKKPKKQRVIIGLKTAILALVLCLHLTGLICIMYASSSITIVTIQRYERLGLAIGITGALCLVGTTILLTCPPARLRSVMNKREDAGERSSIPGEDRHGPENPDSSGPMEEEGATALSETFSSAVDVSVEKEHSGEASALLPSGRIIRLEPEIITLQGPDVSDNAIIGIVTTSFKDLYVATSKALFHMDLSKNEVERSYNKVKEFKEEILMMENASDDLIFCGRYIKPMMHVGPDKEHFCILVFRPSDGNVEEVPLANRSTWAYKGWSDASFYVTDALAGKIQRLNVKGEKQGVIGERILKDPRCVVQNSERELIVADVSKNDMFVFNAGGEFLNSMKITLPKHLEKEVNGCNRLAVGPDDRIYATGPSSGNIVVFSADRRFEKLLPLDTEQHDVITSLFVHRDTLYVAHKDCVRMYPLKPS